MSLGVPLVGLGLLGLGCRSEPAQLVDAPVGDDQPVRAVVLVVPDDRDQAFVTVTEELQAGLASQGMTVLPVTGERATRAGALHVLRTAWARLAVEPGPEDRLVFWFVGHGTYLEHGEGRSAPALELAGGSPWPIDELLADLDGLEAALAVVDACYVAPEVDAWQPPALHDTTVLTSSSPARPAYLGAYSDALLARLEQAPSLITAHALVTEDLASTEQVPWTWPGTDVRDVSLGTGRQPSPLLLDGLTARAAHHAVAWRDLRGQEVAAHPVRSGIALLPISEIAVELRASPGGAVVARADRHLDTGDLVTVQPPEGYASQDPASWLQASLSEQPRALRWVADASRLPADWSCAAVDAAQVDLEPGGAPELLVSCREGPPRWLVVGTEERLVDRTRELGLDPNMRGGAVGSLWWRDRWRACWKEEGPGQHALPRPVWCLGGVGAAPERLPGQHRGLPRSLDTDADGRIELVAFTGHGVQVLDDVTWRDVSRHPASPGAAVLRLGPSAGPDLVWTTEGLLRALRRSGGAWHQDLISADARIGNTVSLGKLGAGSGGWDLLVPSRQPGSILLYPRSRGALPGAPTVLSLPVDEPISGVLAHDLDLDGRQDLLTRSPTGLWRFDGRGLSRLPSPTPSVEHILPLDLWGTPTPEIVAITTDGVLEVWTPESASSPADTLTVELSEPAGPEGLAVEVRVGDRLQRVWMPPGARDQTVGLGSQQRPDRVELASVEGRLTTVDLSALVRRPGGWTLQLAPSTQVQDRVVLAGLRRVHVDRPGEEVSEAQGLQGAVGVDWLRRVGDRVAALRVGPGGRGLVWLGAEGGLDAIVFEGVGLAWPSDLGSGLLLGSEPPEQERSIQWLPQEEDALTRLHLDLPGPLRGAARLGDGRVVVASGRTRVSVLDAGLGRVLFELPAPAGARDREVPVAARPGWLFVLDTWSSPPRLELWTLDEGAGQLVGILAAGPDLRRPAPSHGARYDPRLDALLLPVEGGVDAVRATSAGPRLAFRAYTSPGAVVVGVLPGGQDELFVLEREHEIDHLVRVDLRGGAHRRWRLGPAAGRGLVWQAP